MSGLAFFQRFYTAQEAMQFLAMNRNEWQKQGKPYLTAIRKGTQKVVYDYYELNALADKIKSASGRPAEKEIEQWDNINQPDSIRGKAFGKSTRLSEESDFQKARAKAILTAP